MTALRYLALALLIPLFSACDTKPTPAKVAPAATPPAAVEEKPLSDNVEPATEPKAETVPVKPHATPTVKHAEPTAPAVVAKPPVEQAKTKLDLSLPPELAEQLNAEDHGGEVALAPLLPPLFEERKPVANPFQLSGRLLTNEADKDYWDSVEGAELQFEFKR
ncbi:hypothetical protein [Pseudomonas sp. UBA2684]|uniref:hypothetical protein n=1 Tax=Pseudomonas sp. UBA2684 TaxID=1947311 RepID=UPI000E7E9B56|nr:hypothetical protein [Pseudomonas sp. UBA2684]HBX53870.1 hypothetical protein [Pseudomonas sp.]|tara:strand:- start:34182 stop:34670 length:489 start_codon:yes stop_codon:yes gene_type:complete